jgi:allantoicase
MADFIELIDLAAERLGGSVLWATDDFFAEKENLLKPHEAVFIDGKYTDRGKWMDGWESRRKRQYAESTRAYRLSGVVRGFVVDTAHFKGNYPKACAIEGASIEGHPDVSELLSSDIRWTEILPKSELAGDSKNRFEVNVCISASTSIRTAAWRVSACMAMRSRARAGWGAAIARSSSISLPRNTAGSSWPATICSSAHATTSSCPAAA